MTKNDDNDGDNHNDDHLIELVLCARCVSFV